MSTNTINVDSGSGRVVTIEEWNQERISEIERFLCTLKVGCLSMVELVEEKDFPNLYRALGELKKEK